MSLQAKKSQNQSGELQEGYLDKATRAAAVRGSLTTGGESHEPGNPHHFCTSGHHFSGLVMSPAPTCKEWETESTET